MSTTHLAITNPPPFQGRAADLSSEILENIFFRLVQNQCGTDANWDHEEAPLPLDLHNVTQVCRNWRRVALDRHKLWTSIEVRPGFAPVEVLMKGVDLIERYLARSGPILPLDINVYEGQFEMQLTSSSRHSTVRKRRLGAQSMYRFMHLLLAVRQRLRTLNILFMMNTPNVFAKPYPGTWPWKLDDMPQLESLTAIYPSITKSSEEGIIDLSACSNRIHTCDISGSLRLVLADGLVFSSLTNLQFQLFRTCDTALVGSWYDALRRMPALKILSVTIFEDHDWDHRRYYTQPGPFTQIELPRLEKLRVYFTNDVEYQDREEPYKFLDGLLCPQLTSLSIVCMYDEDSPDERGELIISEALVPSGPVPFLLNNCVCASLERLHIGEDMFYEHELVRALERCTGLQLLQIDGMRFAENSTLLKELHLERPNPSDLVMGRDVHGDDVTRPLCPNLTYLLLESCLLPSTTTTTEVVDMIVSRREKGGSKLTRFELKDCGLVGFDEDPRVKRIREELKEICKDESA